MENTFFMHRIKHNKSANTWDKGIEVHATPDAAKQSYHAYLGAYAYGKSADVDYVSCAVTDIFGRRIVPEENWMEPTPEPTPEPVEPEE